LRETDSRDFSGEALAVVPIAIYRPLCYKPTLTVNLIILFRRSIFMEPEPEHGAATISLASYVRLIGANRNFRRLWLAQIVSEIGDWFYTLSIYTLLLQLT